MSHIVVWYLFILLARPINGETKFVLEIYETGADCEAALVVVNETTTVRVAGFEDTTHLVYCEPQLVK